MNFLRSFWHNAIWPNRWILLVLALIALVYAVLSFMGYTTPARADPRDTCQIQRVLQQKGLYDGERDCIYGPGTRAAVARFQRLVGLADDGVVGEDTLDALFGRPERRDRPETPSSDDYRPEPPVDRSELGQCGDMITVKGGIKTTEFWARSAARKAWQTQVGDRYGNKYVQWDRARDKSIECDPACATCTLRFECSAKGVPCRKE